VILSQLQEAVKVSWSPVPAREIVRTLSLVTSPLPLPTVKFLWLVPFVFLITGSGPTNSSRPD